MKASACLLLAMFSVLPVQASLRKQGNGLSTPPVRKSGKAKPASAKAKKDKSKATYRRVNALRVSKVDLRSRTFVRVATPPAYSAAIRATALAFVTPRMEGATNHFEQVEAMRPFFDRLAKASREGSPVHVLQYGDSHTASDDWAESMRETLQNRYGFGGPGFTVAGHPYRGYRRFDIRGDSSPGWITTGTVGHQGDGANGLAGVSITADRPAQTVSVTTSGDRAELSFLRQPGGGTFEISTDGGAGQVVSTDGELGTGFYALQTSSGEHSYTVRTLTYQPVRLFGWVSENEKGLTWETLGINGAQAGMILNWNEAVWREQIERRDPALVVIAYGTNEALYPLWTAETYKADLQAVIARFKRAVPNATLLLVGPPSCGRLHPFPHLEATIDIQREVAKETGVAFWDWESHMDESGGRVEWVEAGLSQPDYTHLTGDGYRLLGRTLADEIDLEYRRYISAQASAEE